MGKKKKPSKKMHTPAQVQNNALLRFEQACDLMVGKGHFSRFTKACHMRLLANRLDSLKLKIKASHPREKAEAKFFEDIFREQLNLVSFTMRTGETMPLSMFLREGLGLIFYVEAMKNEGINRAEEFVPLFDPYFSTGNTIKMGIAKVLSILYKLGAIMSDLSQSILVFSVHYMGAYSDLPNVNEVPAEFKKPETCTIKIDGISREAIRLCWSDLDGKFESAYLSPAAIGLDSHPDQSPVPVYIQKHALQRLAERLGLVPGILHHEIFELFMEEKFIYHKRGESTLVELSLWEKKLGYLVCCLAEGKIIIRTFLFLTNDGTPEGKRLSRLTQLERLDKRYLEIDTLAGFIGFNIAADPQLSALFTEAGCGDLLDAPLLKLYMKHDIKEKDVLTLLKYMTGRKEKEMAEAV